MKLLEQNMANLSNFMSSNDLHPLHVENCDSNWQLVLNEDFDGKYGPEMVKNSSNCNTSNRQLAGATTFHTSYIIPSPHIQNPLQLPPPPFPHDLDFLFITTSHHHIVGPLSLSYFTILYVYTYHCTLEQHKECQLCIYNR